MLGRAATILALLTLATRGVAQPPAPPLPGEPPRSPFPTAPKEEPPADRRDTGFREPPLTPAPALPRDPDSELVLPDGQRVTLPATVRQQIRFTPRYGTGINAQREQLGKDGKDGQRWVATGGVIVSVVYLTDRPGEPPQEVEFATDCAVAWISSKDADPTAGGVEADGKTRVELYLCGNVVIRRFTAAQGSGGRFLNQILRAKEVYYDVSRNRAVAMNADVELRVQGIPDPLHLQAAEMLQYGPNEMEAFEADTFSSKRPSQPGLKLASESSLLQRGNGPRTNFLGIPYRDLLTGKPDESIRQTLDSRRVTVRVFDFPVFFLPRTSTDLSEPFGPLAGFGVGSDQVFGTQIYTTFDIFKLLALRGPPGHKWNLYLDFLSFRGPGVGTLYQYQGRDLLGLAGPRDPLTGATPRPDWDQPFTGFTRGYVIGDKGEDNLGPDRGLTRPKPYTRHRFQWQHNGDLYENGTTYLHATAQVAHLSDYNFLEQFYKQEFDIRPNQETFLHLAYGSGNAYASLLAQKNFDRPWVTETQSLPRADAALVGESVGPFTYTAKGSLGYYEFRPVDPLFSPFTTLASESQDVNTFRGNVNQRLSLPTDIGPVRVEPYGVMDLAYYSQTINENRQLADGRGRFYGGGGGRVSTTLSRLDPTVRSELFNLTGLNHKVTFGADYFASYSDTPYTRFPLLDRLNDDATDQGYRNARAAYQFVKPLQRVRTNFFLAYDPIYDPQRVAIRRLVTDRVDTLDSMEQLKLDVRNRWQTKRGFPGQEHVVDWLSVDASMVIYPNKDRDNQGQGTGQYMANAIWNFGDRTSLFASGWYEPDPNGDAPKVGTVGLSHNRPDGSNLFVSYRYYDPLESRVVAAGVTYPISRKYTVNANISYDVGLITNQVTSLSFSRVGTDVTFLVGFSYNAIVKNFGFQFALVPNIAGIAANRLGNGGFNSLYAAPGAGR